MQVWNVLYAARWKYRMQKVVKKSPSGHHRTILSGYIFATNARIDNRKKNLLSSNISSTCFHNMVNFGPLAAEIGPVVWAPLQISTGFASWQCYCTALQYWASAKLCGVEQRAPPIFGRAAITLGIGPHSTWCLFWILAVNRTVLLQCCVSNRWLNTRVSCFLCDSWATCWKST